MNLLPIEDGTILVKLARLAVESYFSKKIIDMPESDRFTEQRGVFVTLNELEHLRGCIGFPEPVYPLKKAIIESARSAAFKDPRFIPVAQDELEDITFEISVLTKPVLVEAQNPEDYLDKIEIGKHGLIIKSGFGSGLLLPQVFTEYKATPKTALEMLCQKAGLDEDAWQDEETKIYSFQAQIFEETEPNGKVIEKNKGLF